jgi:hypothetical protein
MNAQEILALYATGHRDFSHVSLVQVCGSPGSMVTASFFRRNMLIT